ncbi:DJ-1/PfpI family protein, partial [Pseudomonas sp. SIMBA_059]
GSLVLGAAGLLKGYRATSHWSSIDQLALLGAEPVSERVVRDRNRISGAGVTSGIDFALTLVAEIAGDAVAKSVQLQMEYDPEPPFT